MSPYFLNLFVHDPSQMPLSSAMRGYADFALKLIEILTVIAAIKYFAIQSGSGRLAYVADMGGVLLQLYVFSYTSECRIQLFQSRRSPNKYRRLNSAISISIIISISMGLSLFAFLIIDEMAAVQAK